MPKVQCLNPRQIQFSCQCRSNCLRDDNDVEGEQVYGIEAEKRREASHKEGHKREEGNKMEKRRRKRKKKKGFKSHIAHDKHLNSVSLPIYRELISSFFLASVDKHFLNFSFFIPYFSRCISGKLLPLSFYRIKFLVGYQSDFSSHTRECNSRKVPSVQ